MVGRADIKALADVLIEPYLFPRERLKRACRRFEAVRVFEPDWPDTMRLISQRLAMDLMPHDPEDLSDLPDAMIEQFLNRLGQLAAMLELPAAVSVESQLLDVGPTLRSLGFEGPPDLEVRPATADSDRALCRFRKLWSRGKLDVQAS
jgi:hypothetical protein